MAHMPKGLKGLGRLAILFLLLSAVSLPVLAESPAGTPVPGTQSRLVTLELKGSDVRDVLQMLAELGGVNIVADEKVKGEVTLALKDVPFSDALGYVTRTTGFAYQVVNGTILVSTPERLREPAQPGPVSTEVIRLKFADPAELKDVLAVEIPSGRVTVAARPKALVVKGTAEELAAVKALIARLDVPLPVEPVAQESASIFTLRFADPDEVKQTLGLAIDPKKVSTDKRSRSLIVKGTKDELEQVRQLVETLDRPDNSLQPATPQETQIFTLRYANPDEVSTALAGIVPAGNIKLEKRTGNLIVTGTKDELAQAKTLVGEMDKGVAQIFIDVRLEELTDEGLLDLGLKWPAEVVADPVATVVSGYLQVADWTASIKALEKADKATLLANPKLLAVDGQESKIHIGDSIPVTVYEIQDGQRVAKIQFIETGIVLTVTPKVNGAGVITAKIAPEVSNVTGYAENGYPQIRKRQAETTLRLLDGQTVAIGGLRIEQEVKTREGLPGLGRIPLFGSLFSTTRTDRKATELVIFLTARLLKEDDASPLTTIMPAAAQVPAAEPAKP